MPEKKQWIVVTSGDQSLNDIAKELEKKGFTIDSKLEAIGQIVGTGTEDMKTQAMKIKGVSSIEPSHEINIGPPNSDLTW
ncbi:hypothetical protein [Flavisolibacter ginsenosidimutans]|uniref:Ketohydroxyglutarate aldolase n=1 Tax=Flavisolibacter ginsenosidimutans TaxID=661481 RepID=A0A5B8UDA2_9BACT|nr:hypothetical protein [Flavisolibacter ginsenosidimutans]QEC54544.1 hypothetical protein FSB75_01045 [Flavisolibacter ginsenosidimutans]